MVAIIFNKHIFDIGETAYVKIKYLPMGYIKLLIENEKNGVVHEYQFLNLDSNGEFPYSFKITENMIGDNNFIVQRIYLWWHENLGNNWFYVNPLKVDKGDKGDKHTEGNGDKTFPSISSAPFVSIILLLLLLLIAIARRKK